MPIRAQLLPFYPLDWPQLSASIRFRRARGRCEQCDRPHGRDVQHLGDGTWYDDERGRWIDGRGRPLSRRDGDRLLATFHGRTPPSLFGDPPTTFRTRVYIAAAHLDHDPSHSPGHNLRAFCQRCHMLHDRDEHRRQRWLTLHRRRAIGDLFLGLYEDRDSRDLPPLHKTGAALL